MPTQKSLENLKKGKATQFKSGAIAAENGKKGGIAYGQNARKRANMAAIARQIADAPITNEKNRAVIKSMGVDDEDINGSAMVVAGIYKKAASGDDKAYDRWMQLTEAGAKGEKPFELPARIIGKDFVDINRQILPNMSYIFKGGRGSTKSSYISEKIVELIKNNPNIHCCIVRKVAGTIKDSVFTQMKWAIHELGLEDEFQAKSNPFEIIYKPTGQIIYFRGCDDPTKLKSIKPPFGYIGILWIEERDQLNGQEEERSIRQSVLRGGDNAYFFASYNPPKSRSNWVNKELAEIDQRRVVHTSNYQNVPVEWLGQMFIDDAEHLKEVNPKAYEHEYMGIPNGDGGSVFDNIVDREITDKEIDWFDHIYMGVDWGFYPDPFVFIRLHYDRKKETIYLIDELYLNKTSNEEAARLIREKGYTETFITCDSAEPKSVADFRACGLSAQAAMKGAGSVEYGIKWLLNRKIVIDKRRTPNAYKEFINYEYMRDKDGNVISGFPDKDNHVIDAVRYALERVYKKYGSNA